MRVPRRTRRRSSRDESFSSAIAAESSFCATGTIFRRVLNFGISQRNRARASATPIRRLPADTQHSRTRRRQRSLGETILRASNDSRRSRAYAALARKRTRLSLFHVARDIISLKNCRAGPGVAKIEATASNPRTRSFTYFEGLCGTRLYRGQHFAGALLGIVASNGAIPR